MRTGSQSLKASLNKLPILQLKQNAFQVMANKIAKFESECPEIYHSVSKEIDEAETSTEIEFAMLKLNLSI